MGSFSCHPLGRLGQFNALSAFVLLLLGNQTSYASGESLLLPGYVQARGPNVLPAPLRNQTLPSVLPGWATANPGYILQPNPSGLKLIIDNSWPDLPGYRMVRIEFQASQPPAEERRLRVQIKFQNGNYSRAEMTVTTDEIVLPVGQSAVKYQLYFPSDAQQRIREVRTSEDGETWPDLSCSIYTGQSNRNSLPFLDLTGLQPKASLNRTTLFIQGATGVSTVPDPLSQSTTQEYRNGMSYSYPMNNGWSGISSMVDLPNNPLGYDCFKVVFCRAELLETLRADHPVQWEALQGWIATGGKLLVWPKTPNDPAATRATEQKLDKLFPHGELADKDSSRSTWQKQTINRFPEALQIQQRNNSYDDGFYVETVPVPATSAQFPLNGKGIDFPMRTWFQGTIAVLPEEQLWDTIYSHLHNSTPQPLPATPLPLVGLPPITMFQVLITLFVILIGPVNYFYFKKKKRMNWLLITVPAGALAITGLLLAYTLMKDGIGVRTWSQSYTVLDQVQKLAATRQQFGLFAGVTPGDGLRFRDRVNFEDRSVDQLINYSYRYRDTRNWDYSWDQTATGNSNAPEQHFRSGWLPARTLKLFETREFAACQRELKLTVKGDSCELKNQLGTKVLRVFVAAGENIWSSDEVDENDTNTASLFNQTQVQNLQMTIGQATQFTGNNFEASNRRTLPPQDNTLLERFLELRKSHDQVYLAIVERWPELQSGVADPAVESWGPHVILGVW